MSGKKSVRSTLFGIILMLTVTLSPLAGAQTSSVSATILTEWVDEGNDNITHGYRIVLSESLSFAELDELAVTISHEDVDGNPIGNWAMDCLLYTSPSPRDRGCSRMPSSA